MREFAEKVAAFINDTTDYEADVRIKEMPDGTQLYSVSIKRPEDKISPTVYVDNFTHLSVEEAAVEIIKIAEQAKVEMPDISFYTDWEKAKKNIIVRLMPKTFHADVFRNASEFGFDDLILVPYVVVKDIEKIGEGSIKVLSQHIENWGLDEETVMNTAIKNTVESEPYVMSMSGFLNQMYDDEIELSNDMFIITNKDQTYGASAILGCMDKLKKKYKDGFYVIPASIHETLVVPIVGGMSKEYIDDMVQTVNATTVHSTEILANHVYQF